MLTQSSAVIATNLSEILVEKGNSLVPKANTLLSELNKSIINNVLIPEQFTSKEYIAPSIVSASVGEENVIKGIKSYVHSSHDSFMDNYIEDISKLVTNYISFARNVVNKEVNLLKEELESSLSSYKYKEPEDFFNVNYFKLNEVFGSYIVSSEIVSYGESKSKYFFESLNLNKVQEETFELQKYLLTGDTEQDSVIQNWLGTLDTGIIKNYITNLIPQYELSTTQLLNYALVNYLFYRNLTERVDIETGLSEGALRTKSASNRDYFGNMLFISLELYHKDIRNGRLLSSNSEVAFSYLNDKPLSITIYEENLAKLAEAGLNIEVVFGYISSGLGSIDVTVDKLIAESDKYISKWSNTRSLYLISLNNSRLDIFKQILRERFEGSLVREEKNEDEQAYLLENTRFCDETKKLANQYIDQLHVSDIDDLCTITLDLVAKIRYRFTNSYYILKQMNEILKMNDKIEPMEAALYASINYITDYLLEQIDTVKI